MSQLPRRPRSQRLDSEGRTALEQALPETLMVRHSEQPEYGIDGEIEAFELGTDAATGLHFYFQLKSTDENDLSQALRVRLKTTTANYLRKTSLPVLIVCYHSPSKQVYARWFHHYDPYHESTSSRRGTTADTITFHLTAADLLDETKGRRLADEATAWLDIRGRSIPQPLPVVINSSHPEISTTQLQFALAEVFSTLQTMLSIVTSSPLPVMRAAISVSNSDVHISIAETTSLTLHGDYGDEGVAQLATDLCFALAIALLHAALDAPGIRIAVRTATQSRLMFNPDLVRFLASALKGTNRYGEALALGQDLAEAGGEKSLLAQLMMLPLMGNEGELTQTEISQALHVYELLAGSARSGQDLYAEAGVLYSAAKFKMALKDPSGSIDLFERAKAADSTYESRGYFWSDLGAALFLTNEFAAAAGAYGKACVLDPAPALRVLHADALMMAGKLSDARQLFQAVLKTDPLVGGSAEWQLKLRFIKILQDEFGYGAQVPAAASLSEEVDAIILSDAGPDEAGIQFHELLDSEPLNAHILVNLAASYRKAGSNLEARELFLGAALIWNGDLDSWVDALLLTLMYPECHQTDPADFGDMLLQAASHLQGPALLTGLAARLKTDESAEKRRQVDELLDMIATHIRNLPVEEESNVVRFPGDDGAQFEIAVERLIG